MSPQVGARWERVVLTVAAYAMWFVTAALGVLDLLAMRRLVLETYGLLRWAFWKSNTVDWARGAVDKGSVLLLSVIWVILVYVCEAHYRKWAAIGWPQLLRGFAWITGIQLVLLALGYLSTLFIA